MKKSLSLMVVFFTLIIFSSTVFAQGLIFNKENYEKSVKLFGKFSNAKTPQGKGMGFVPINVNYDNEFLQNKLKRDLTKNLPTSVDYSSKIPGVGDQGSEGSCVCWATGYYYKSFQEQKQYGWNVKNPQNQTSPYFLWNNNGGGQFFNAMELMRGWGACPMDLYPSYNTATEKMHFEAAAKYKAITYSALFARDMKMDGLVFKSRYNNDINQMKQILANGEVFVIGLPVFMSLFNYYSGIYDVVDTNSDTFQGLHALCVVGYDDNKQAFKIVNSWGYSWGENGYAWFSYNFMKKFIMELWVMTDETGAFQNDYDIIYKGYGIININNNGIHITKGGLYDTIKITLKKGISAGNPIPLIETDGSFDKFYSDAPINSLIVKGALPSLSSKEAIGIIQAGTIGNIKMTGTASSTWDYFNDSFGRLNYYSTSSIYALNQTSSKAKIDLVGIVLDDLTCYSAETTINVQTKVVKRKTAPDYYSESAVSGNIKVNNIKDIKISGGDILIENLECTGNIGSISATGMAGKLKFLYFGDGYFMIGGNLNCSEAMRIGGSLKTLSASHKTLSIEGYSFYSGGSINCRMVATGLTQWYMPLVKSDISKISGTLNVFGKFMAGANDMGDSKFSPTFSGAISSIATGKQSYKLSVSPKIAGEGWSNKPIKFSGEHIQFVEHYY